MPYCLDPGLRGALLLGCFVLFPAIVLVVRWKWRLAEARRTEVVRLMRLAVAEAERAEREVAAFASVAGPVPTPGAGEETGMSICAVCQSPTTNRCARCKIVKYCSGKCQIIHWRQGHKDECHPAPVDYSKSQPHVPDFKGGPAERSEITDNGSEIEFNSLRNVAQRVFKMEGVQAEETFFDNRRSASERENVEPLETSNKSVPLKSDHTTKDYSEIKNINHKLSASDTEKGGFTAATITSSASSGSGVSSHGLMLDDSSSNVDHTEVKTGKHSNTNTSYVSFDHPGKPFFSDSLKSSRTSIVGSEQPMCVNEETECKSIPLSSIKSSNRYLDVRFSQKGIELRPAGSSSKILNNSEISKFYKRYKEAMIGIIKSDNYTESQTSFNSDHSQMDAKLHSEKAVKLSTPKPFVPSSIPVTLEPSDTKNICSGQLYGEKSKEHLNFLSPSIEDHSSPLVEGPTSPINSSCVKRGPLFPTKSFKISGSLLNGKALVAGDAKQILSSSSLRRVQPGVLKCNYKILFPYDLFIKLYNSDKVGLIPCGLINCGNSCYANAALQCLAFTRPLAAYLLEGLHAKTCPKKEWCFTCAFESLLVKANQGKSPLSPIEIISHIHDIGGNFSKGAEEDAHEFLRHAIDAMQSACLKEAGANAVGELAQETTLIQLMFGGYLHSKIKCMRCKSKSERREKMMDLTVEMHGDIETLEEALARFTATEVLEGVNKYKCDRCKSYEHAKKHLTILEAPNVLTIALKRYQPGEFGKLSKMVRFPEYLNLAPYMRGSDDNSPVFRLYAVVVHNNVMNATFSGHYLCFVKNTLGKWFKADDSAVMQVELQTVLSQGAYMLLYARCSPRAPSLLRREIAKKSGLKQTGQSHSCKVRPSSVFSQRASSDSHRSNNQTSHAHSPSNFEPQSLFNERVRRSKLNISSDSSSLFSYSDESSSWSAESTKDSATSEDFTESLYAEQGHIRRNSPLGFSEESGSTYSPRSNGQMLESPDLSPLGSRLDEEVGSGGEGGFQGRRNLPFLYSRNLTEQCSSRSVTNCISSSEVKPSVLLKRSSRDRTAQTFY